MAIFPNPGTQFKPGESGNPAGKPKGVKHISTWINELLNDESFTAQVQEGLKIVEYKGAPIKAIIQAQMRLAMNGDTKAADTLFKHGGIKQVDITTNGKDLPTPILGGGIVPSDDSNPEDS